MGWGELKGSSSGTKNKRAVVLQLMSAWVSLWISCTTTKKWPNLFFFPLLGTELAHLWQQGFTSMQRHETPPFWRVQFGCGLLMWMKYFRASSILFSIPPSNVDKKPVPVYVCGLFCVSVILLLFVRRQADLCFVFLNLTYWVMFGKVPMAPTPDAGCMNSFLISFSEWCTFMNSTSRNLNDRTCVSLWQITFSRPKEEGRGRPWSDVIEERQIRTR